MQNKNRNCFDNLRLIFLTNFQKNKILNVFSNGHNFYEHSVTKESITKNYGNAYIKLIACN